MNLLQSCLCFQAIVIIAKLSFGLFDEFLVPSITTALDQYKERGYAQKVKTGVTPQLMQFGHQELVEFLHQQVNHIHGMYIFYLLATDEELIVTG